MASETHLPLLVLLYFGVLPHDTSLVQQTRFAYSRNFGFCISFCFLMYFVLNIHYTIENGVLIILFIMKFYHTLQIEVFKEY